MDENAWEFDDRRRDICTNVLIPGEELVWHEADSRFDEYRPVGTVFRKVLRRTAGAFTFLVQDKDGKTLTVGTQMFADGRF